MNLNIKNFKMRIKKSLNKHIEKFLKRYPSLYYGKNARIMCMDHILLGYGNGIKFEPDGSIVDVYDKTDAKFEADRKLEWERDKKKWLTDYKEKKKSDNYKDPMFKEIYDRSFRHYKWYYEKFDAYADIHKDLRDGTFGTEIPDVHEIRRDYKYEGSLVNNIPDNAKKEVLLGFIEILDYMIQTNQGAGWAKKKKKKINEMLESRKKK